MIFELNCPINSLEKILPYLSIVDFLYSNSPFLGGDFSSTKFIIRRNPFPPVNSFGSNEIVLSEDELEGDDEFAPPLLDSDSDSFGISSSACFNVSVG